MYKSAKVVVITGCSSGFGEGAVKAFADKGYRVWGTIRDAEGRNSGKESGAGGLFVEYFGNRHRCYR